MKSICVASVALSLLVGLASCGKEEAQSPTAPQSDAQLAATAVARKPAPLVDPLDEEAISIGWRLFKEHWTQCDDTYITLSPGEFKWNPDRVVQLKNVTIQPSNYRKPLTEADRLNGLDWPGPLLVLFDARRERVYQKNTWEPWLNSKDTRGFFIYLIRKNATWVAIDRNEWNRLGLPEGFTDGDRFEDAVSKGNRSIDCGAVAEQGSAALDADSAGRLMMGALASKKSLEEIQVILKGQDINARTVEGSTILIIAVNSGRKDVVAHLLEVGADPNAGSGQGMTPLYYAIASGSEPIVRTLVEAGAKADGTAPDGQTYVQMAEAMGLTSIAHYLRAVMSEIETAGLILSDLRQNNLPLEKIKLLLQDINVNARTLRGQMTFLCLAITSKRDDVVEYLIARGADLNALSGSRNQARPLEFAILEGSESIVRKLVEAGVEYDYVSKIGAFNGKSPIELAEERQQDSIAQYLRERLKKSQ